MDSGHPQRSGGAGAGRAHRGPRTKAPWGKSPRAPWWQAIAPRWRPSSSSLPCGDHLQLASSAPPLGQPNLSETRAVLPCSALASFRAVGRSNSLILPYATLPAAKGQAAHAELRPGALTPSAAKCGCTRPVPRGGQQSHLAQCHSFPDCDGPVSSSAGCEASVLTRARRAWCSVVVRWQAQLPRQRQCDCSAIWAPAEHAAHVIGDSASWQGDALKGLEA